MTYFNINNPFVQAPSLSYLLLFLVKASIFYPLLFWGDYRHVSNRVVPISYYLGLGLILIFFQPNLFGNDIVLVIGAICAQYFFNNPYHDRISTISNYFGFSMLIYYFSSVVCLILSRIILVTYPQYGSFVYLILVPIIYLFSLIIIKLTRALSIKYFKVMNNDHIVASLWISILFIPLSLFFYFDQYNVVTFNHILKVNAFQGNLIALAISITYFLIILLIMRLCTTYFKNSDQVVTLTDQLQNLEEYTSELEVMYDDLRRFRHDYKNILYSLDSSLETNNLDHAKHLLSQLASSNTTDIKIPISILNALQNVLDPEIKSIIYGKMSKAIENNLHPRLEVIRPIRLTETLKSFDAVRILAILLDNAINGALQSEEKNLSCSIFENENAQFIIIGNSTFEDKIDLNKMDQDASSVNLLSQHHLGLRNLQIILGQYPNAARDRSANHHWFEQRIIVPKKQDF